MTVQSSENRETNRLKIESNGGRCSVLHSAAEEKDSHSHECLICGRIFPTYHALGGHKASHKNSKSAVAVDPSGNRSSGEGSKQRRVHRCTSCRKTFATGQALGGHKRKHYQGTKIGRKIDALNSGGGCDRDNNNNNNSAVSSVTSSHHGGDSGYSVDLDLNLTLGLPQFHA